MGMVARLPLRELIREGDVFVVPEDNGSLFLYNAFMCAVRGSPILRRAIEIVVGNVQRRDKRGCTLCVTGPAVLADAFADVIGTTPYPGVYTIPILKNVGTLQKTVGVNEGQHYSRNVLVVQHWNIHGCVCGSIGLPPDMNDGHEKIFFDTRYGTYRAESKKYNLLPHYSKMWEDDDVFE